MHVCANACVCLYLGNVMNVDCVALRYEYDATDSPREEMKRKFAPTMDFVEEYLRDVVSQPFPFGDSDKNELTLEVWSDGCVLL